MLKQALKQFFQGNNFFIFALIIIGIFVRFLWLDKIPVGITHDDADVILSAKSIWETGRDISGTVFPSTLFFNKTPGKISGLPSAILAPILGPFPLNLFSIHFVYVLINILTILMVAGIAFNFFKNIELSLSILLIGLFNPWLFVYSRYPTEAPFALLFVLFAIYFLYKENIRNIFISTFFFILSFYSYFGAKVAIPIVFPVALLIRYLLLIRYFEKGRDRINIKSYILSALIFLIAIGGYFFVVLRSPESTFRLRATGEFIFSDMGHYQTQVDELRRASIEFPLKSIFFNKYTLLLKEISGKYIGWISPDFLFTSGDQVSVYRLGEHGLFYIIDLILIFAGVYWLASLKNKTSQFYSLVLFTFVLIAPLGSAISKVGTSYFFRSFLLIPAVLTLLGFGLYFLMTKLSTFKFNIILVVYALLFTNFLVFYFFRYPVKQQDNQFLEGRILSSYLQRSAKLSETATVFTQDPLSTYHLLIFYTGIKEPYLIPFTEQYQDIGTDYQNITNNCEYSSSNNVKVYETKLNCPKIDGNFLIIQNQKDAGSQFVIYNDKVCLEASLDPYRRDHRISDFSIESMSDKDFCNRWIFKK